MVQKSDVIERPKVLFICGPTAVGKTKIGLEFAKLFDGEIISADSMQIYKHLNIGTAKPSKQELREVKHHLVDIKEPDESYSVAEFKREATEIILKLAKKGKLPIVVGGTGLFIKALLFPYNFCFSVGSKEIRDRYALLAKEKGNEFVHSQLKKVDKISAEKLHFNDLKRVIRALEIYETTGKPKTETAEMESPFDYEIIFLNTDRKVLYDRIDKRVDDMFLNGLETEVKNLVKIYGLTLENQSIQGIGYKEFFRYFAKEYTYEDVISKIKQNSRHYAKRQITWFKAMPNIREIDVRNKEEIMQMVKNFLSR